MGKNKLRRFAELEVLERVFQPGDDFINKDHPLKGKWRQEVFQNDHPIIIELGCGRGEYTIQLAKMFPENNFIGIDKKGARLWRGAKTSNEDDMKHTAFIRIQGEHLESFFAPSEINEIWITFPDPQIQGSREKNRMTSPKFLNIYKKILIPGGVVHLKTDNVGLFEYSKESISASAYKMGICTHDLYNSEFVNEVLSIKTTYENRFLKEGMKICYLNFVAPR